MHNYTQLKVEFKKIKTFGGVPHPPLEILYIFFNVCVLKYLNLISVFIFYGKNLFFMQNNA